MKQQHVSKPQNQNKPLVIDTQKPRTDIAVRTVLYIEVGDMNGAQVNELAAQFVQQYDGQAIGKHYIIPVRNGRISTDVEFESEFLETINKLCEAKDGKIVFREEAPQVKILRQHISGEDE